MLKKLLVICMTGMTVLAFAACTADNQNAAHYTGHEARPFQMEDADMNFLSAESTNIPSHSFPHTKPVQVQEAVFEFDIDPSQIHLDELYDLELDLDLGNIENELQNFIEGPGQETRQDQPETSQPDTPDTPEEAETQQGPSERQQEPQEPDQATPPQQEAEEPQQEEPQEQTEGIRQEEQQVIELTNNHRREAGLSELQADTELSQVARRKSSDMDQNNYFSHTSPTYGSPFDMIRDHGIDYSAAGENIAQGQRSPEEVVQAWMDSPGHRENILNANFTHIGVGYEPNGNHWTQMFISR